MTEDGQILVTAHAAVECTDGLTVSHLRTLLAAVDEIGIPDQTEIRVRTMWRTNAHGSKIKRMTAATQK